MKRFKQFVTKMGNRFSSRDKSSSNAAAQANATEDTQTKVPRKDAPTPSSTDSTPGISPLKEDLPEPTSGQLSHTAALHRISVRPKNRRPPRRSSSNGAIASDGPARLRVDSSISENSIDTLDSLEGVDSGLAADSPEEASSSSSSASSKPAPIVRKSSSRLSRNSRNSRSSEVFEELEAKPAAVSPDSLESNADAAAPPRPSPRSASLGSDAGEKPPGRRLSASRPSKSPDSLEGPQPQSGAWLSKSSEGLGHLGRPVPARRLLLQPISKSQERVCCGKSADSPEPLDDSPERRRSSFEIRPRRSPLRKRSMSKSSECFDSTLHEQRALVVRPEEKPQRASLSEVNLSRASSRGGRLLLREPEGSDDGCKLEGRGSRPRRQSTPKRLGAGGLADEPEGGRPRRSSESSELGSTDTLDSERRHTAKSSDSDETLDSLERESSEQPQPARHEDAADTVLGQLNELEQVDDEELASYWRRRTNSQDSKESNNLDIHQLLAYSLVSPIQENGNHDNHRQHDRDSASPNTIAGSTPFVVYPRKKLLQQQTQPQSSSEDNKTLTSTINNLLSSKTDEDLQNMLNGNISEVSTDTKSFKEKLIMFEKLGK